MTNIEELTNKVKEFNFNDDNIIKEREQLLNDYKNCLKELFISKDVLSKIKWNLSLELPQENNSKYLYIFSQISSSYLYELLEIPKIPYAFLCLNLNNENIHIAELTQSKFYELSCHLSYNSNFLKSISINILPIHSIIFKQLEDLIKNKQQNLKCLEAVYSILLNLKKEK
jgi:hypothetical protein